jgi:aspartate carbamoyltransferase catalytic subunit
MLKSKDLLGLKDISAEEIEHILETAKTMKYILTTNNKKTPHLQGKSVVTLFYENSTRTRLSFELASKYMSSSSANVSASSSSVSKGETLIDTAKTIDMMGTDVIILRHPMSGAPHLIAKNVNASVINAGDGMNEHPTQALLDMFTIYEKKGSLKGLKVAIIGDIMHSRVARTIFGGMTSLVQRKCGPAVYFDAFE